MPDNQTKEEWLDLPSVANNPSADGTGVFIRKSGGDKEFAKGITYDKLLQRDANENFYAFSWVPDEVASYDQVSGMACNGRCANTCKRPGCLCDRSVGKCR